MMRKAPNMIERTLNFLIHVIDFVVYGCFALFVFWILGGPGGRMIESFFAGLMVDFLKWL